MSADAKGFLGKGWSFPVGVDKATGRIALVEHEQDIAEALRIILATRQGERLMQPQFGSTLHEYVFERAGFDTAAKIQKAATDAIEEWEPRVTDVVVEARFPGEGGGFALDVSYVVRATNSMHNLVYPYFLTEGA
jgi:phage baseplate assembly protein W